MTLFFPPARAAAALALFTATLSGHAQAPATSKPAGAAAAAAVRAASAPAQAASGPAPGTLPALTLSKQFAGPLPDTAVQRFIDSETGVVCYLYTPYTVINTRDESGRIVYGANNIGSISCVPPWRTPPAAAPASR